MRLHYFLLVAVACATSAGSANENLLLNEGFEQGENKPRAWNFNRRETESQITWEKSRSNSGKACGCSARPGCI